MIWTESELENANELFELVELHKQAIYHAK